MDKLVKVLLSLLYIFSITFSLDSTSADAKTVSYLMNTKKSYTYDYGNGNKLTVEFWRKSYGYNQWSGVNISDNVEGFGFGEKETKKGLYYDGNLVLSYPLKKGKKWSDPNNNNSTFTIKSIDRTIKTPAGTFKKVVEVRETVKGYGYYTTYFAPGNGVILRTTNVEPDDFDTVIHYKLISIKNKK